MTELFLAALALGLGGALHCVAMCGPLAVAGCRSAGGVSARMMLGYHGGRVTSYALAGALFGTIGGHAARLVSLPTLQRGLLLAVAAMALARGVSLLLASRARLVPLRSRARSPWFARVARLVPRRGLGLGLFTGAMPCAMLAAAWALAAASGHPARGAAVMLVFAAATAPALLASVLAARPLARIAASRRWSGILWCALALWISLRPLLEPVAPCHGP